MLSSLKTGFNKLPKSVKVPLVCVGVGISLNMVLGAVVSVNRAVNQTKVSTAPKETQVTPPSEPSPAGDKLSGYTIYFGSDGNGGMVTQEGAAYWDPSTKTVSWDSIRFNGMVECRDGRIFRNGQLVSDPVGCEFDTISPATHPGVPPQVFVTQYNYGQIAQGRQTGGVMQEKVVLR